LAFSAALYSGGAEGVKFTLMSGLAFSKAGMSFCCQMARSSLRQLSMFIVAGSACAMPAVERMVVRNKALESILFIVILPLSGRD
jgi:hypothetical protein